MGEEEKKVEEEVKDAGKEQDKVEKDIEPKKEGIKEDGEDELSRRRGRDERERDDGRGDRERGDRGDRIGRDMFREVPGRDGRPDFDRGGREFRGGGRGGGPDWRGGGRGRGMDLGDRGRGFRGGGRGFGSLALGREDQTEQIDREKVCPMLLRIFCKFGDFHEDSEFSWEKQPGDDEVRVHTWRDATLGELTELLAQVHREVRQQGTRCSFKVVYPDASGKWASHQLGSTAVGRRLQDDAARKSLAQIRFQVGDFLSVAIYPAKSGYNKAMEKAAAEPEEGDKDDDEEEGGKRRRREAGDGEEEEKAKEEEKAESKAAEDAGDAKQDDAMEKDEASK